MRPILSSRGVTDVFGPSDVYGVRRLTAKDTILLRGAVTETLEPKSSFVNEKNDPMQPLAWLHPYTASNGKKGTTFCTTMGGVCGFSQRGFEANAGQLSLFSFRPIGSGKS